MVLWIKYTNITSDVADSAIRTAGLVNQNIDDTIQAMEELQVISFNYVFFHCNIQYTYTGTSGWQ